MVAYCGDRARDHQYFEASEEDQRILLSYSVFSSCSYKINYYLSMHTTYEIIYDHCRICWIDQ